MEKFEQEVLEAAVCQAIREDCHSLKEIDLRVYLNLKDFFAFSFDSKETQNALRRLQRKDKVGFYNGTFDRQIGWFLLK